MAAIATLGLAAASPAVASPSDWQSARPALQQVQPVDDQSATPGDGSNYEKYEHDANQHAAQLQASRDQDRIREEQHQLAVQQQYERQYGMNRSGDSYAPYPPTND